MFSNLRQGSILKVKCTNWLSRLRAHFTNLLWLREATPNLFTGFQRKFTLLNSLINFNLFFNLFVNHVKLSVNDQIDYLLRILLNLFRLVWNKALSLLTRGIRLRFIKIWSSQLVYFLISWFPWLSKKAVIWSLVLEQFRIRFQLICSFGLIWFH